MQRLTVGTCPLKYTDCTEEGQQPTEQERLNTGLVPTEGQGAPVRWIRETEQSVQYMPIKI